MKKFVWILITFPFRLPTFSAFAPVVTESQRGKHTPFLRHTNIRISNSPLLLSKNEGFGGDSLASTVGLAAQPIVWVSLYNVATTGAGLPAGPFGLIGAFEGLSYVAMLVFCATALFRGKDREMTTTETVSLATLGLSLIAVAGLIADQGCIPNAKPILDYSAYVRVCDATPGLFGEP